MRDIEMMAKKKKGEERRGVLFTDVCVWWLADLANVPCVILVVYHITGLAESKLLLSHVKSDGNRWLSLPGDSV